MIRPSISKLAAVCLAVGIGLMPALARAERADRDKPMNIESDALRYDDKTQTSTFTGRVVLTKGTIVMRGARLDVRQDDQGNQFGTMQAEPGKRAFFRQKREGLNEFIEGEGETIEYDSKTDTVRFLRRAEMRRLAMRFNGILRGKRSAPLDLWIDDAIDSELIPIMRFARVLRRDIDAVNNAIELPWSNGQAEGQINRLKTLKRAMYGRAGPELLRARMLPPLHIK